MPLYQYVCRECGQEEEIDHTMDETFEGVGCANCRGALRRVWTAVPVHFKGSGWAGKSGAK